MKTPLAQLVRDHLTSNFPAGSNTADLCAALPALRSKEQAAQVCNQLLKQGHVVRSKPEGATSYVYTAASSTASPAASSATSAARPGKNKAAKEPKKAPPKKKKKPSRKPPAKAAAAAPESTSKFRIAIFDDGSLLARKPGQPDYEIEPDDAIALAGFCARQFETEA